MNQTIMILNDKETLAKIAEDPDTELRIKNSLVDSIVKRVEKKCSSNIRDLVDSNVKSVLIEMNLMEKGYSYGRDAVGERLLEVIRDSVDNVMETKINSMIRDEINKRMEEVSKMLSEKVEKRLKAYNQSDDAIWDLVEKATEKYVYNRLQRP